MLPDASFLVLYLYTTGSEEYVECARLDDLMSDADSGESFPNVDREGVLVSSSNDGSNDINIDRLADECNLKRERREF